MVTFAKRMDKVRVSMAVAAGAAHACAHSESMWHSRTANEPLNNMAGVQDKVVVAESSSKSPLSSWMHERHPDQARRIVERNQSVYPPLGTGVQMATVLEQVRDRQNMVIQSLR